VANEEDKLLARSEHIMVTDRRDPFA
jgi:hypothetical protein